MPELLVALLFEDGFQILFLHAVIEKSVVTDFLKTGRKYMHKKTPDKFRMLQGYFFHSTCFIVTCRKGNGVFCYFFDTAVGDGNAVGIAAKILNGIAKTIKGFLDIGTPFFYIEPVLKFLPFIMIFQ